MISVARRFDGRALLSAYVAESTNDRSLSEKVNERELRGTTWCSLGCTHSRDCTLCNNKTMSIAAGHEYAVGTRLDRVYNNDVGAAITLEKDRQRHEDYAA
ncbi:hypothetical protein K0M31_013681 [Melipona bicolor]|uniref:Uncharacterized protein n=1 Tax=Melipona bicolor TaxID=60889 RepID=A0AA40FHP0_9HYME|nr:hypothetical protein K0M31_013681 [Melipona bicolor]